MSCVFIPYPTRPDVAQSEVITVADERTLVTLGPRKLLEKVTKEIQEANPAIDVVDGLTFRDVAFPEGDWNLAGLLEPEACERVREQLGVDYLVLVGPMSYVEGEPKGHFGLWIGGYGAAQVDIESELAAVIVDLKTREAVSQVTSEAHGTQTAAGLFYFVVTFPITDSAAIRGLGDEVARVITERAGTQPVRIAVLAGEPTTDSDTEPADDELAIWNQRMTSSMPSGSSRYEEIAGLTQEQLLAKAERGDAEARLQLYWSPRALNRLGWLCRAADQGHPDAQYRLGLLHQHGKEGMTQDPVQAYMWYRLAAANGHHPAAVEAQALLEKLSAGQAMEAEGLLQKWGPGQCELGLVSGDTSN
jgi:hypothetical protein